MPKATQNDLQGNSPPLSTSGGQRVVLSGHNLGAFYTANTSTSAELEEVGFGPSFALKILPIKRQLVNDAEQVTTQCTPLSILCTQALAG